MGCSAAGGGRPRRRVGLAQARRLAWPRAPLASGAPRLQAAPRRHRGCNNPEPGAIRKSQRHTHGAQAAASHSSQRTQARAWDGRPRSGALDAAHACVPVLCARCVLFLPFLLFRALRALVSVWFVVGVCVLGPLPPARARAVRARAVRLCAGRVMRL